MNVSRRGFLKASWVAGSSLALGGLGWSKAFAKSPKEYKPKIRDGNHDRMPVLCSWMRYYCIFA